MTTKLRDSWVDLVADSATTLSELRLRLVFSAGDVRVFAAVTAKSAQPALLLELPDGTRPRTFKTLLTRAFQLSIPSLQGLPDGRWALLVELKDPTFIDLFEVLAEDLLAAIRSVSGPVAA